MDHPPIATWGREIAIREVFRLLRSLGQADADAVDRFEQRLRRLSREQLQVVDDLLDRLTAEPGA